MNLGFSPTIGSRISVSLVGFDGSPSPARFSARTRNSYLCPVCKDRIFVVVPSNGSVCPYKQFDTFPSLKRKRSSITYMPFIISSRSSFGNITCNWRSTIFNRWFPIQFNPIIAYGIDLQIKWCTRFIY